MKNKCPFLIPFDPNLFRFTHPKVVGHYYGEPVWNSAKMTEQEWTIVRMNQQYGVEQ